MAPIYRKPVAAASAGGTAAAIWAPNTLVASPQHNSYHTFPYGSSQSTGAVGTTSVYVQPFRVQSAAGTATIRVHVATVAGTAGSTLIAALYSVDVNTFAVGPLIKELNAVDSTTAGTKILGSASLATPGGYAIAFTATGSSVTMRTIANGGALPWPVDYSPPTTTGPGVSYLADGIGGTWPTNLALTGATGSGVRFDLYFP